MKKEVTLQITQEDLIEYVEYYLNTKVFAKHMALRVTDVEPVKNTYSPQEWKYTLTIKNVKEEFKGKLAGE